MCPHPLLLPFIVTTRVPFILLIMMSSMNGLNTSRLIIILSVIILSMVLSSSSPSPPNINLQISSPSHFLRDALVIWLTTSSWSHIHLEFEGDVNVYYVLGFRPSYFSCIAHLYLYYTSLVPHTNASYIRHWCIFSHYEIQYKSSSISNTHKKNKTKKEDKYKRN